jgi:hypothetical protein
MSANQRDEVPWLTVRRDEMDRLERLASVVDKVSDDPFGLAAALRKTPTYQRTISELVLPREAFAARRRD